MVSPVWTTFFVGEENQQVRFVRKSAFGRTYEAMQEIVEAATQRKPFAELDGKWVTVDGMKEKAARAVYDAVVCLEEKRGAIEGERAIKKAFHLLNRNRDARMMLVEVLAKVDSYDCYDHWDSGHCCGMLKRLWTDRAAMVDPIVAPLKLFQTISLHYAAGWNPRQVLLQSSKLFWF